MGARSRGGSVPRGGRRPSGQNGAVSGGPGRTGGRRGGMFVVSRARLRNLLCDYDVPFDSNNRRRTASSGQTAAGAGFRWKVWGWDAVGCLLFVNCKWAVDSLVIRTIVRYKVCPRSNSSNELSVIECLNCYSII